MSGLTRIVTPPPPSSGKQQASSSPLSVMQTAELVTPTPRLHEMLSGAGDEAMAREVLSQLQALAEFYYVQGIDAEDVPPSLLHCSAVEHLDNTSISKGCN